MRLEGSEAPSAIPPMVDERLTPSCRFKTFPKTISLGAKELIKIELAVRDWLSPTDLRSFRIALRSASFASPQDPLFLIPSIQLRPFEIRR